MNTDVDVDLGYCRNSVSRSTKVFGATLHGVVKSFDDYVLSVGSCGKIGNAKTTIAEFSFDGVFAVLEFMPVYPSHFSRFGGAWVYYALETGFLGRLLRKSCSCSKSLC